MPEHEGVLPPQIGLEGSIWRQAVPEHEISVSKSAVHIRLQMPGSTPGVSQNAPSCHSEDTM